LNTRLVRQFLLTSFLLWTGCAWLANPARAVEAAYAASVEHEVKAAFVYRLVPFIHWRDGKFENPDSPIHIGFLGRGPINESLLNLQGKEVLNRNLKVSRVTNIGQADSYHIIFVNAASKGYLRSALADLRGKGVLTIGDTDGFSKECGMIQFYLDEGKVRLEINLTATQREGLKIHSNVLRLARISETPCH